MENELSQSAKKVQDRLRELGVSLIVKEMPATTRTAKDAAAAIGCAVDQIAKSLVFRTQTSRRPVLVIASGSVRVNEQRIGELVNEPESMECGRLAPGRGCGEGIRLDPAVLGRGEDGLAVG